NSVPFVYLRQKYFPDNLIILGDYQNLFRPDTFYKTFCIIIFNHFSPLLNMRISLEHRKIKSQSQEKNKSSNDNHQQRLHQTCQQINNFSKSIIYILTDLS